MVFKIKKAMSASRRGFSLIELLVVVAIISIFILAAIFAYRTQLAKGRDAKRKADLAKMQKVLEDYLNDEVCYPTGLDALTGYISEIPKDPINNTYYNYFYSYDGGQSCKSWYKIYTKLENTKDSIIAQVGCSSGCGPSGNYNYWVASPNMNQVAQIHPAENWWPAVGGATPTLPLPTSTPPPTLTPTPTLIPGATPTPTPTLAPGTPTPTPSSIPSPTPSPTPAGQLCSHGYWGCFNGTCRPLEDPPTCSPSFCSSNCDLSCIDPDTGQPINECL